MTDQRTRRDPPLSPAVPEWHPEWGVTDYVRDVLSDWPDSSAPRLIRLLRLAGCAAADSSIRATLWRLVEKGEALADGFGRDRLYRMTRHCEPCAFLHDDETKDVWCGVPGYRCDFCDMPWCGAHEAEHDQVECDTYRDMLDAAALAEIDQRRADAMAALSSPIASGTPEAGKAVEDQELPASRPSGNVPDKGAPK